MKSLITLGPEASPTIQMLSGTRCSDARLYTLNNKDRYQNERSQTLALLNLPLACLQMIGVSHVLYDNVNFCKQDCKMLFSLFSLLP